MGVILRSAFTRNGARNAASLCATLAPMTDKPRGRPPWELEERENCFVINDTDGRPLYSIYFYRREPPVPHVQDRMSWDEALRLAASNVRAA
jgi:hypothetical protein